MAVADVIRVQRRYQRRVYGPHRRRGSGYVLGMAIGTIVFLLVTVVSELVMPYQGIISRLVLSPAEIENRVALHHLLGNARIIKVQNDARNFVVFCPTGQLSAADQARWVSHFQAKGYPAMPQYGALCYDP